ALGTLLHKYENNEVLLWAPFEEEYQEITKNHTNKKALGDFVLPNDLFITKSLEETFSFGELFFLAVPSFAVCNVLEKIKPFMTERKSIIFLSKGLEQKTFMRMTQIKEELQVAGEFGFLAGPTFAKELINDIPGGL